MAKKTEAEKLAEQYSVKKQQKEEATKTAEVKAVVEQKLSELTHTTFDTYTNGKDVHIIKIKYNPETNQSMVEGISRIDNIVTHKSLEIAKRGLDAMYIKGKK